MTGKTSTKSLLSWLLPLLLLVIFVVQQNSWGMKVEAVLELSNNAQLLVERPWTLLSYAFLHSSLLHIGVNLALIILTLVANRLTPSEVWGIFITAAILGGGIFMLIPSGNNASIIGASAGVSALMGTSIYRVFSHNNRWIIILLAVALIDLLTQGLTFSLGFAVHFSGYLLGLLYALYNGRGLKPNDTETEMDNHLEKIIDKAQVSGYRSLTKEEQEKLVTSIDN